jgi:hypothetical protein
MEHQMSNTNTNDTTPNQKMTREELAYMAIILLATAATYYVWTNIRKFGIIFPVSFPN